MDPIAICKSALALAQQCYAQYRQMSTNTASTVLLRDRFKMLEDVLARVVKQRAVAERNVDALTRVNSVLTDGVALAIEASGVANHASFLSRATSTVRRFLKAKTFGEQITELGSALDRALEDLQVRCWCCYACFPSRLV